MALPALLFWVYDSTSYKRVFFHETSLEPRIQFSHCLCIHQIFKGYDFTFSTIPVKRPLEMYQFILSFSHTLHWVSMCFICFERVKLPRDLSIWFIFSKFWFLIWLINSMTFCFVINVGSYLCVLPLWYFAICFPASDFEILSQLFSIFQHLLAVPMLVTAFRLWILLRVTLVKFPTLCTFIQCFHHLKCLSSLSFQYWFPFWQKSYFFILFNFWISFILIWRTLAINVTRKYGCKFLIWRFVDFFTRYLYCISQDKLD